VVEQDSGNFAQLEAVTRREGRKLNFFDAIAAAPLHWRLTACAVTFAGGVAFNGVLSDLLPGAPEGAAFFPAIFLAALLCGFAAGVLAASIVAIGLRIPFGAPLADAAKAHLWTVELHFYFDAVACIALARWPHAIVRASRRAPVRVTAEQLGHLVEQAPAAIAMFDSRMRYLAASARWRACYNLGRHIVGKSHYDIFPDMPDAWREAHRRALAGETVQCEQDLFVRSDGAEYWLKWEIGPWRYSGDRIGGIVIVSEDIGERVRLQRDLVENERRLKAIFESAMDAIVTTDAQGLIQSANVAAGEIFGRGPDEMIGQKVDILMPKVFGARHDGFMSAYAASGIKKIIGQRRIVAGLRKDGAEIPLELAVSEAVINDATIFVGVMRDLSVIEAERRRVNLLRDELAHASRLNDMGGMVAGLAHEVGQPISAIMNYCSAYRRTIARTGSAPEANLTTKIEQQARRAADILKRLRGFIEKRPIELREVAIGTLIDDAIALVSLRSRPRIVRPPPPPEVVGACVLVDPIQIEQVLVNFLRNADDALIDADDPEIVVEACLASSGRVRVSVADNGAGVSAEAAGELFDMFFTTKNYGMGVGLAIGKDVVKSHGGIIGYRPNAPRGSIFEFELPLCSSAGREP
jgi:two-component system sensor kinase FixL